MEKQDVFEAVVRITRETLRVGEEQPLTDGTRFFEDLATDSLDLITLVMGLEEHFGETIPEADARSLLSIGAAVDYIVSRKG
jgi:acyl carrier protein